LGDPQEITCGIGLDTAAFCCVRVETLFRDQTVKGIARTTAITKNMPKCGNLSVNPYPFLAIINPYK